MGSVHHHHIDTGSGQRLDAVTGVRTGTDRRTNTQTALAVLGGQRVGLGFLDVAEGHQAAQVEVGVDHQHFLDAVFVELGLDFFQASALEHGDQLVLGRHDRRDGITGVRREAQVTTGDDAHQLFAGYHREAGEAQFMGLAQQLADLGFRGDGDRVVDDRSLVALDLAHLGGLLLDAHVLVDDANATFLRHGDGQAGFGDGVHGRGNQRNVQLDFAGQAGLEADILRQNLGISRDQENIIESQGFLADTQHGGGSQAGKRKRGIIPTHPLALNADVSDGTKDDRHSLAGVTDRSRPIDHQRHSKP